MICFVLVISQDFFDAGQEVAGCVSNRSMFDAIFSCDNAAHVATYLRNNSKSATIFKHAEELSNMSAETIDGDYAHVRDPQVHLSGIVCTTRSRRNMKRSDFKDCYVTGEGASGGAFQAQMMFYEKKKSIFIVVDESVT
jgi:hypothetical protein